MLTCISRHKVLWPSVKHALRALLLKIGDLLLQKLVELAQLVIFGAQLGDGADGIHHDGGLVVL